MTAVSSAKHVANARADLRNAAESGDIVQQQIDKQNERRDQEANALKELLG